MPKADLPHSQPVEVQVEVPFADGLRFRSNEIWNLPLTRFDDRWDLFNHIIGSYLLEQSTPASRQSKLRFLEIGVWTAGTLPRLVKHFGPIFEYIGVDPFGMLVDDPYKGTFWNTTEEAESVYRAAKSIFDQHNATLLRSSSRDFFASNNTEFDIIFVDGDHRYAGALYDCETSIGRLRSGGLLIVDDVGNSFHPEVEWAVREFTSRNCDQIRRMGAQPLFFQLEGMPVPVVLIFTYFQKV
jgi:hypothetical protein